VPEDTKQLDEFEKREQAYDAAFDALVGPDDDEDDASAGGDEANSDDDAGDAESADDNEAAGEKSGEDDADSSEDDAEDDAEDDGEQPQDDEAGKGDQPQDDAQDDDEDDSQVPAVFRGLTKRERIADSRLALKRSGLFTEDEINAMPIDALLKRGARLLKADAAFKTLKGKLSANKSPAPSESDDDDFSPEEESEDDDDELGASRRRSAGDDEGGDPASGPSPDGLVKRMVRSITDELNLTDEEQSVVRKRLKSLVANELRARDAQVGKTRKAMELMKQQTQQVAKALVSTRYAFGIEKLSTKFPQLKTPDGLKSFAHKVARYDHDARHALGDPIEYEKFLGDMAWSVFGGDVKKAAAQELLSSAHKAQSSKVLVDGVRKPPGGPLTKSQGDDLILDVMTSQSLSKVEKEKRIAAIKKRIVATPPKPAKKA